MFVDLTQNAKQSDIGLASSLEGREGDEEEKKVRGVRVGKEVEGKMVF